MPNRLARRRQAAAARAADKQARKILAQRDTPREFRIYSGSRVEIQAANGAEKKLATFEGNAYTGAPMKPEGWWEPVIIDLEGVKLPSQNRPALRQHDHQQIVGHTDSIKVNKDGVHVAGTFSGEEQHANKVTVPAKNGFPWQMSLGANPIRKEFLEAGETATVNGREVTGPMTISRETEFGEVSFVPLGADGETSATVTAQKGQPMTLKDTLKSLMTNGLTAAKYTHAEIDEMDEAEAKAALKKCMKADEADEADDASDDDDDDDDGDGKKKSKSSKSARQLDRIQAAADAAEKKIQERAAAEYERQRAIIACCKKYDIDQIEIDDGKGAKQKVSLAAHAIRDNWTIERTELKALQEARSKATAGIVPGGHAYSTSNPEVNEAVLECAMFQAARHQFQLNDDSFYFSPTPDGKGTIRRVPEYMQREAQLSMKARYTDQVQQAAHTCFKARITPRQLMQTVFRANGYGRELDLSGEQGIRAMLKAWDHMEGEQGIRAEGTSNMAISNILANVLNKFALQGYLYTEQAWREIAAIRPVNDFKPTKSINLLGDVIYKALGPAGELSNASIGDQAFPNQAQPYGRILTIPWTHLVNDDLGILTGVPLKIGQGAGLALNDYFWALWASLASGTVVGNVPSGTNLNGDDGVSFWRTTSSTTAAAKQAGTAYQKNKISGASTALASASLGTAKQAFDNQWDPNGNPLGFDGGTPILLFGPANWKAATELVTAEYLLMAGLASTSAASLQPNKNVWAGVLKPVMSRYVENASYVNSTTAWWILFNPAALSVIEVAFLNGVDTPSVLQAGPDYQFDRLGISIRGTMPFGVTQQNFRGGVYSVGA